MTDAMNDKLPEEAADIDDIDVPDLVSAKCEIIELVRRREEGVKEQGDPDDLRAFERRLGKLLDELCVLARKAP